ncbi:MAG: trypsin-like peptidase domain-containing protein [Oscillospiraceae bacterium]|nr:trypsin-like peptidase domain-containing protein [Oscillospiraceae bacterium]
MKKRLFIGLLLVAVLALAFSGCGAKKYTVTFDPNGGELVSGSLTQTVKEGESAQLPEVSYGDRVLTWAGDYTNITADTTVTAEWKEWYTVTFDLNGGVLLSGETEQRVLEGESAVPPDAVNGRRALTWNGDYTNVTADTVVTAEWEKVAMSTVDLAEYVEERTVTVNVVTFNGGSGTGSGFFIDDQGTIVTNFHVIDLAEDITVEVSGGASYPVKKIADFSNTHDLAILKIDMKDTPYLEISEESVRTGEKVFAVGSSLGTLTGSFSDGIVSSTSRDYGMVDCIQMTTPISPGNSGGPLVNEYGEVVGVNTASYTRGENLNLAIKISTLKELSRDKNWTVKEFKEWYEKESSCSWSPLDTDGNAYYSLVNTYQEITDQPCIATIDENWDVVTDDYRDMYYGYYYKYNSKEYNRYTDYLKTVGFQYYSSENYSDGTSYYYDNDKDGIRIDLFITSDSKYLVIIPSMF